MYAYFILKPPASRDIVHIVSITQDARKLARQSPRSSQAREKDPASQARQDSQVRRLANSANLRPRRLGRAHGSHAQPHGVHVAQAPRPPLLYRSHMRLEWTTSPLSALTIMMYWQSRRRRPMVVCLRVSRVKSAGTYLVAVGTFFSGIHSESSAPETGTLDNHASSQ